MAFLTHGGSNSVIEAITNRVPLSKFKSCPGFPALPLNHFGKLTSVVLWPAAYDQVQTASAFSWSESPYRIGVELLQVRNGYNIGRETASGVFVHGTVDAMREEFQQVLLDMQGEMGEGLRRRVDEMAREMRDDMEFGESKRALMRLARF
jgi:hypothetical protein